MVKRQLSIETLAVKTGFHPEQGEGLAAPINLSSTFVLAGDPEPGELTYGRAGSPGFDPFERALAAVEGTSDAIVFNAGVAAANAFLEEAKPGTALVVPKDAYFGIRARATETFPAKGIEVRQVDQTNLAEVEHALKGASLLWTETPTNPLLAVANLEAIGSLAAAAGVPWACDNTFASPALQRPVEYGAIASMESLTKYVGGHSDLILGSIATSDPELAARLRSRRSNAGTQPDGFTCWLARRGLQTLPLRVKAQSASALELAARLQADPAVEQVFYPGLPDHPGHDIAARQMQGGFGGMLSFVVHGGKQAADRVTAACQVLVPATSLGGVESLIERRAKWTGEIAPEGLLRISTGLEHVEDLWLDLEQALG